MKLVVTIQSRRRATPSERERRARDNEFAAALKVVADKIANSGAVTGKHDFEYGDHLHGTIEVFNVDTPLRASA